MEKESGKLVLLRHGKSIWNEKNVFTGWIDIGLSREGVEESLRAGREMAHLEFQEIYTSTLVRAETTLFLALTESRFQKAYVKKTSLKNFDRNYGHETIVPIYVSSTLNERHYGKWQGRNKDEVKKEVGDELFKKIRRGYTIAPPEGESLKMTVERALPYFQKEIENKVKGGQVVLVVAHGNSLRGIVKYLEQLSDEAIVKREIPTGKPLYYIWQQGEWLTKDTL